MLPSLFAFQMEKGIAECIDVGDGAVEKGEAFRNVDSMRFAEVLKLCFRWTVGEGLQKLEHSESVHTLLAGVDKQRFCLEVFT